MAEANLSDLERTKRFDSEYFQSRYTVPLAELAEVTTENITELTSVSDGNHFSISNDFAEEGVPYYRGQDVTGNFFVEQATPNFITETAYLQPHMYRSHLQKDDVLLSIVGTIGELSLVSEAKQATCSCKLAILRPEKINSAYLAVFLRSHYGQAQIQRLTRGAVQMGLLLEDMNQVNVARFSPDFENAVAETVEIAKQQLETSTKLQQQAESLLLSALGLEHWQPPEALTYERSAKDVFGAGRLDAEHFKPKFYDVWEKAQAISGVTTVRLGEIIEPVKNGFDFRDFSELGTPYIRVGDVKGLAIDTEGAAKVGISQEDFSKNVNLRVGDILFTRKGSFGNAAVVRSGQEKSIISSEIMLARIKSDNLSKILPDYLAIFLESRLGRLQSEQWAHGVAFYSITQADFENYRIPLLSMSIQNSLAAKINESQAAKNRSTQLLELAKRAVEIAIEESEAAALAYLQAGQHSA